MTRAASNRVNARSPRSLAVSAGFKAFVLDQLEDLGDVTPRSMFGGVGLYCAGVFFAILARDKLYFKTGEANRRDYTRRRMQSFKPFPDRPGRSKTYYEVPLAVIESPIELVAWARKAIAAASDERR
ncbi:MAG TPA: TfoX/Sxy family protein [Vicinamibacterales bacterium]|nr:TfoX/Sxy family protein [Vicinamibacterales bacterium]